MRATISVPDDVLQAVDRLARRTKRSRSQLFGDAIREYVTRHAAEEITEDLNRVCAEVDQRADKFAPSASGRTLKYIEW